MVPSHIIAMALSPGVRTGLAWKKPWAGEWGGMLCRKCCGRAFWLAMVMGGRKRASGGYAAPASPLLPGYFLAVSPAHGPKPFSLISLPSLFIFLSTLFSLSSCFLLGLIVL